ncbi:MAG: type I methionyl aminopeptidase [Phycisphaerae bacterium]
MKRAHKRIILKSAREISLMREAGKVVFDVLKEMERRAKPGVTTGALNEVAEKLIADAGAVALFKGVVNPQAKGPFPAALCTSVNDEVVHGIPGDTRLNEGDIVSVDCGVRLNGYCGDAARTFAVGAIAPDTQRLLDVTREALDLAVREIRVGRMWSEIAARVQASVEDAGFSVVRDFVGHGIGQEMHEEPKVPNYSDPRQSQQDFRLERNMTLAIEPMVNMGSHHVRYRSADRWAIVTRDGHCAAHFEDTVAVFDDGAEVLTGGSQDHQA